VRVGFTGAGATGKSTVIREIALLSDCPPILTSVARGVFAERGLSSESQQDAMTPAERWDLQMEIFDRQFALERSCDSYVTERTSLCRLAYCVFRNGTAMSDGDWERLSGEVESDMRSYDAVFYFPVAPFNVVDDGFRQGGRAYNWCLDSMIRSFLIDREIPFVDVGRTSVEERVSMIASAIGLTTCSRST
jgi:hypothetical protein